MVIVTKAWRLYSVRSVRMASTLSADDAAPAAGTSDSGATSPQVAPLTMQIVVRRDLLEVGLSGIFRTSLA